MKTQIVTEIVTKEQSADQQTTESILIVIVVALCLIIVAITLICVIKRKSKAKVPVFALTKDSDRAAAGSVNDSNQNTSFEDN